MFRLFRPQIVELLNIHDAVVADRQKEHSDEDLFEDRNPALPSRAEISPDEQIHTIKTALEVRINETWFQMTGMAASHGRHR